MISLTWDHPLKNSFFASKCSWFGPSLSRMQRDILLVPWCTSSLLIVLLRSVATEWLKQTNQKKKEQMNKASLDLQKYTSLLPTDSCLRCCFYSMEIPFFLYKIKGETSFWSCFIRFFMYWKIWTSSSALPPPKKKITDTWPSLEDTPSHLHRKVSPTAFLGTHPQDASRWACRRYTACVSTHGWRWL